MTHLAAISAHRGGSEDAPPGSYEAYRAALQAGAEYAEFDIRRTSDGQLVVFHDASTRDGQAVASLSHAQLCQAAGYEVPTVPAIMRLIAGRAIGHLDLKERGTEDEIVGLALDILGADGFVATTLDDAVVSAIHRRFPAAPAALSLGRDLSGLPWRAWARARSGELFPVRRIHACGASWCAMHYRLAQAGVLRQCHQHGIRTMVWTVNEDQQITRLLADPRVDVVVTDRPRRALALRESAPTG